MDEINEKMGTLDGIQIRAEAKVLEYFYNNTQVNKYLWWNQQNEDLSIDNTSWPFISS